MTKTRIRQLVFASRDAADIQRLKTILDLGEGFVDPGVGEFGLTNGVFALGDQFLEVVVPVENNTAAGRFMDRSKGRGGYMAIFQTDDLARVRSHADAAKIRRVWNIDLPDISASHLHPGDIGAAIVSIDEARPPSSWRWGGPDWQTQAKPGALTHIEISAASPPELSAKWAGVLGIPVQAAGHDVWDLELEGATIRVVPGDRDFLSGYTFRHPDPGACLDRARDLALETSDSSFDFAGVKVSLVAD
ncbi:MAG: hypothetical protein ABJH52_14175 [Henriciella sp.]